jgi:K+-sensing histidine kinase KdpD
MRHWLDELWNGPADLAPSLQLEWRFVLIRWIGIARVAPGLPMAHLTQQQLVDAYAILGVATVYNLLVTRLIRRKPEWLAPGYLTSTGDALLNVLMMLAAGGFDTPLSYLLFTVVIATAMRYGYGPAIAMATLFVLAAFVEGLVPAQVFGTGFFFRSGFLYLTALCAGYLRQQASNAEAALEKRLQAANLLNDATAKLGASLELDPALQTVASAAAGVFRSANVILYFLDGHDEGASTRPFVRYPESLDCPGTADLRSLCLRRAAAAPEPERDDAGFDVETLEAGRRAVVLTVSSSRSTVLATLAIALGPGAEEPQVDRDIVESFVKRASLAIENATLYRTLTDRTSDLQLRTSDLQHAYADLDQAHRDLLRVDEMKTDFLANVSHEFRTPLTSIRSFSELLLTYGESVETQREFVEIINLESDRLTRMVNDVLDITKIESGNMDWQMAMSTPRTSSMMPLDLIAK